MSSVGVAIKKKNENNCIVGRCKAVENDPDAHPSQFIPDESVTIFSFLQNYQPMYCFTYGKKKGFLLFTGAVGVNALIAISFNTIHNAFAYPA